MKNLLVILLLSIFATGQKKPVEQTALAPHQEPTFEVKFDTDSRLSVPFEGTTAVFAEGCDSDGNPYIQVTRPFDQHTALLKVRSEEITTFDTTKTTDIVEPQWIADFVSESEVYGLIEGDVHKEYKKLPNGGWYLEVQGEPHYYIARFDADGSYKGALKLDLPFRPTRLAGFQSGNFLIAGYDGSNALHLALLDSSGQLLRYIEFPKEKHEKLEDVYARSFGNPTLATPPTMMRLPFSAFTWLFQYQNDVLYVRGRSGAPIYEIRDSGEVRTVPIKTTNGYTVEYILQSDRNWFVVSTELGKYGNENNRIYEVSPSTGEVLGRYLVEGSGRTKTVSWQSDLACVHEGEFVLVRQGDGTLKILHGTPVLAMKQN